MRASHQDYPLEDGAVRWRGLVRRDPEAARIIAMVAGDAGLAPERLLHGSRCIAPVARARQMAMYLLHTLCSRSQSAVAATFGRDRTTVRHACALIEDAREDARMDARLEALEAAITANAEMHGDGVEVRHAG